MVQAAERATTLLSTLSGDSVAGEGDNIRSTNNLIPYTFTLTPTCPPHNNLHTALPTRHSQQECHLA